MGQTRSDGANRINGVGPRSSVFAAPESRRSIRAAAGFEAIAVDAISYVELVTDDGKQHRVRAVEQLAIFNRLKCQFRKDVGSAAAVPTKSMSGFRLQPE